MTSLFDQTRFLSAAMQTARASRLETMLARVFGKRIEEHDGRTVVVMYQWRGKLYMTDHYDSEE